MNVWLGEQWLRCDVSLRLAHRSSAGLRAKDNSFVTNNTLDVHACQLLFIRTSVFDLTILKISDYICVTCIAECFLYKVNLCCLCSSVGSQADSRVDGLVGLDRWMAEWKDQSNN